MAVIEKTIADWKRIMLDTSVILSLFLSEDENCKDEVVSFNRKLIDFLEESKSGDGKDRTFLVSTVVITEILVKENDQEKIKKILRVLNSSNVEFVDFDLDTSLMFNYQLHPHLGKKSLHKFAEEFGFKTHEYMMAREWINRDFMIMMSGVRHNADVILTADKNTFYPLAEKANAFCALTYPKYFEQSPKFIIGYKHKDVVSELLGSIKETLVMEVPVVSLDVIEDFAETISVDEDEEE
ncbi:hypothetical protein [uncultured Kriegella sp.]|uniref:hypothetical protein n=1 Tax=uncultured Kriegella sp. TaxID=1798910 RepID=UPI0030D86D66|tara:strand:+ start:265613 stop:266329 length:717 start_codon:yes stop_codon:yes gene_type:complete